MKIGNADETRDNLSSMKSVSKEYIMSPETEVEIEEDDVDDNTGELTNIFDDWDFEEEEEKVGSNEPIGSHNSIKFKPGDRVEHKSIGYGTGTIINKSVDNKKMEIDFDNGKRKHFLCWVVDKGELVKKVG